MKKLILLAALIPATAQAQVCTVFPNDVVCTDGTTIHRYDTGVIELNRPRVPLPYPHTPNEQLTIMPYGDTPNWYTGPIR